MADDIHPEHKPSAFYFRQALRTAATREQAVEIGLHLVKELEWHKEQLLRLGVAPIPQHVMLSEVQARGWKDRVARRETGKSVEWPPARITVPAFFCLLTLVPLIGASP